MPAGISCQEEGFTPSRDLSLRLFEEGKFDEAFRHYKLLMEAYPADPLYKYYSGVCLLEMGTDIERSVDLLKSSIEGSSSLRKVPENAWYYLGRGYQAAGQYDEAIESYDSFRDRVRKKDLKAYNIDDLISQCVNKQLIKSDEPEQVLLEPDIEIAEEEPADTVSVQQSQPVQNFDTIPETNVSSDLTPDDYDAIARQAIEFQFKADSLSRLAERYRSTLRSLTGNDREAVSNKIVSLEKSTFEYQSMANRKLTEAARFNRVYFGEVAEYNEVDFTEDNETDSQIEVPQDSVELSVENIAPPNDSLNVSIDTVIQQVEAEPVLAIFDSKSTQADKIPVNDTVPEGLFYRIQTAAFRNPIKPSYFKTLGPVYGIKAGDSDITFYNIGFFRRKADADKAVLDVRAAGFRDAFVIAQFEGDRVSFERSEILEKEWGNTSLFEPHLIKPPAKPSEPVTLVFRVEVLKSGEEIPEDELQTLRLVAGSRQFDILQNEDGEYVYLIGKFLTFDSALSYSDLLFRNGMKESRVAAYLGLNEIPLEKAKELFEQNYRK